MLNKQNQSTSRNEFQNKCSLFIHLSINLLEDKRHFVSEKAKKKKKELFFFFIIERRSRLQKELETKSENQRELILNDETKVC